MIELTPDELVRTGQQDLHPSPWRRITQEMIDTFADATGDHQWIHVDQDRAAGGPFGTTIAHGYLTVSLIPTMLSDVLRVRAPMGVNYGIDSLRLTRPVRRDSRIRLLGTLVDTTDHDDRVRYTIDVRVEVEGEDRPALVGTIIYLAYR